jgi:hypothetical protein
LNFGTGDDYSGLELSKAAAGMPPVVQYDEVEMAVRE